MTLAKRLSFRLSMRDLTHEELLLLLGAITAFFAVVSPLLIAFGSAFGAWLTARRAARKDDLELLRNRVDKLEAENEELHRERIILYEYIARLRVILQEHGIEAPPLEGLDK